MRHRSPHQFLPIIVAWATLLIISGTAEAGITLTHPVVKQTGDPHTEYDFSIYLTPGFTANPFNTIFTLKNLIGLDFNNPLDAFTDIKVTDSPPLGWLPLIDSVAQNGSIPGNPNEYYTTTLSFSFIGLVDNNTSQNELLGNFAISDENYSIPALPTGSVQIDASINGQSVDIPFTVVPEPSSLVVVGLVGVSLMGVGLLRRRRHAA